MAIWNRGVSRSVSRDRFLVTLSCGLIWRDLRCLGQVQYATRRRPSVLHEASIEKAVKRLVHATYLSVKGIAQLAERGSRMTAEPFEDVLFYLRLSRAAPVRTGCVANRLSQDEGTELPSKRCVLHRTG